MFLRRGCYNDLWYCKEFSIIQCRYAEPENWKQCSSIAASSLSVSHCWSSPSIFHFFLLIARKAAWDIILVEYVFMYFCLCVCQTTTFESLDVGSSYLHMRHISTDNGSSSYMKVIGSRSRSQDPKRSKIPIPACKTSIGHNSRSIKHTAVMLACSMGFSGTAGGPALD